MKKHILTFTLALFALASYGQTTNGMLMNRSNITTSDLANLSFVNRNYTTARVAAMAGAFTSLGADMATMSINPAGLAMYKSSDASITYSVNTIKTNTSGYSDHTTKTTHNINNLGAAFNMYNGKNRTSKISGLTLGVAYNKLADFNQSYGVATDSDYSSINEVFASQLGTFNSSTLGSNYNSFSEHDQDIWGAILAYRTEAVDPTNDAGGADGYQVGSWYNNTLTSHYLKAVTSGYSGEYNFSLALSIDHFIHLGASIGVQVIEYNQSLYYDESYDHTYDDLRYLLYDQNVQYSGAGLNFKLGVMIQPTDNLRIGLAVHTPSAMTLNTYYKASMNAYYDDGVSSSQSSILESSIDYSTPTRLLVGASYVFGGVAILSLDYERAWYNHINVSTDSDWVNDAWDEAFENDFKASNNFRAGLEIIPTKNISLRLGYGYFGNTILDKDAILGQPTSYKGYTITGGLGFKFGISSLDLAYTWLNTTSTNFDFYYCDNNAETITSSLIKSDATTQSFIITYGVRF